MAAIEYVDSGAGGANNGTSWTDAWNAATALESALGSVDAAGIIYVASRHAQQAGGSISLASTTGTSSSPIKVITVQTGTTTYETMVTEGNGKIDAKTGGAFDIQLGGWDIYIGLKFVCGDDLQMNVADKDVHCIDCTFSVDDVTTIATTSSDQSIVWENCFHEQVTAGGFVLEGRFLWRGGQFKFNGGTINVQLFMLGSRGSNIVIEDVDIQDLDGDDSIVNISENAAMSFLMKRCKVPAALGGLTTGTITGNAPRFRFHSVSSAVDPGIIYQFQENYFLGQINEDTAVYLDATYDGTNGYSVKMVSTANTKEWTRPLKFKLAEIWAPANATLTVELNTDNVTLQNDEFWIEIEAPDATFGHLGIIDKDNKAATVTTNPSNLPGSAAAWTEGFGTEVPQKISETVSSQSGIHTVWACLAKPSTTVYVDTKVVVS